MKSDSQSLFLVFYFSNSDLSELRETSSLIKASSCYHVMTYSGVILIRILTPNSNELRLGARNNKSLTLTQRSTNSKLGTF